MEIKLAKSDFLKKVYKMQGIAERKHPLPILAHFLIRASQDGLCQFIATDLEAGIRDSLYAEVIEPGDIALHAKRIYDILRELPEAPVLIKTLENDWVQLECERSTFLVMGHTGRDFPELPDVSAIPLSLADPERLSLMLAKTVYAAGSDENRQVLNSVLYVAEETHSRMVATDGHRLSFIEWPLDEPRTEESLQVIISLKAVRELRRMLTDGEGPFRLGANETNLVLQRGESNPETVIAKVISGDYPDYTMVIPQIFKNNAVFSRDGMLTLLRRVGLMADERSHGVAFLFHPNYLEISSHSIETGQARDQMAIDYEGPELKIGFNWQYLIDALKVLDTEFCRLQFVDGGSPVLITTEGDLPYRYKAVIMPMTLRD